MASVSEKRPCFSVPLPGRFFSILTINTKHGSLLLKRLSTFSLWVFLCLLIFAHASAAATLKPNDSPTIIPAPNTTTNLSPSHRLKIGLVLAGGGARGLAHIGVIKSLEAQHIKIDYIAGTSMGALVGGLYAAGMPINQIETLATSVDWEQTFHDDPIRFYQSFRRKQEQFDYFIKGEIGMNHWQLRLPTGLLQGQKQDILLESMLLNTAPAIDFDKLPIPFRAVATDIENGRPYVLKGGNLAKALRASMSVPGIFAPVEIDGHLLVDGGITDNTPINLVRKMGADIVIVSDIHDERVRKDQLKSLVDITNQIITGLTLNNTLQQLKTLTPKDILIRPDLKAFSSTDFDHATAIVAAGEAAAQSKSASLAAYEQPSSLFTARRIPQISLRVNHIELDNTSRISNQVILNYLHQKVGEDLNRSQLEADLSYLYGLGFFKNISYDFINADNQGNLVIHSEAPEWGPNFFKLKFNLASNLSDQTQFNLGVRHTYLPANDLGAEWRNEAQIGQVKLLKSEFYQPLDASQTYYAKPFIRYHERSYTYNDSSLGPLSLLFDKKLSQTGLELGVNLSASDRIFARLFYESGQVVFGSKSASQVTDPYHQSVGTLGFQHDTLDQTSFPSTGTLFYFGFSGISNDTNKPLESHQDELKFSHYFSYQRHTLNLYAEYSDMNGPISFSNSQFYTLGGFQRLSGYRQDELIGNQIAFTRLKYQYRWLGASKSVFNFPLYAGATLEAGNVFGSYTSPESIDWNKTQQAASVFIGMNSFLGPIYIAYGYHNSQNQSVYFYFGQDFD